MNNTIFVLFAFYTSIILAAPSSDPLWMKHCQEVGSDADIFLKKLALTQNKISFTNRGGLFNGGVCWWHARLTRIVQYLAVFDPLKPAPTDDEAYKLVKRLRDGKPVTIPGFNNFYEFSNANNKAVQKNLEDWQIANGGFELGFLDGLSGSTTVEADDMKALMDENFNEWSVSRKPIYQVLQLPGFTAHAWLLIDMQKTVDGYEFSVVDSNYLYNQTWIYKYGATGFFYGRQPFVNYTTRRGRIEEEALSKRLYDTCQALKTSNKLNSPPWTLDEEVDARMNLSAH